MFTQAHRTRDGGRSWGCRRGAAGRAALVFVVGAVGLTAGCGDDPEPAEARTSPKAAGGPTSPEPSRWSPWLTSFHGGGRDDGPHAAANACAAETAPGSEAYENEGARHAGTDAGRIYCDGTGFSDEALRFKDGAHLPREPKPDRRADFAHRDGLAFTNTDTSDRGDESGGRLVRALEEKSREKRWEHDVRSRAVLDGDAVLGDEWTEITNEPPEEDGEPWTPEFKPGGDVIAWDARSGKEQWRLEPPAADQWCSPAKVADDVFITCEDQVGSTTRQEITWYALDEDGGEHDLRKLYSYQRGKMSQNLDPIGMDGDDLLFLPAKGRDFAPQREFEDLIRVDAATGKQQRSTLPTSAIGKGATPYLLEGDLYFAGADADARPHLVAVSAADGRKRWTAGVPFTHASAPTVSTERDEVYLVDPAGRLAALSRKDGHQLWKTDRPRAQDGGTKPREMDAESSATLVNDVLVVSTGNTVFSVRPSDPDAKIRTTHRVDLDD